MIRNNRQRTARDDWTRPRVKSSIIRDTVDLTVLYPPTKTQETKTSSAHIAPMRENTGVGPGGSDL